MTGSRLSSEGEVSDQPPFTRRVYRLVRAPGRIAALGVLALLLALRWNDPRVVTELRLQGVDLVQHIAPRAYTKAPVSIVAVDEKSLARYGQWPWPRTLVAQLVDRIAAARPAVLGVDIIFVEPDRLSLAPLAETIPGLSDVARREMAKLPANEIALAAALRRLPVVLGVAANREGTPSRRPFRIPLVRQIGADPRPFLLHFPVLVRSLATVTAGARSEGALVGDTDPDGILRRVPTFVVIEGHIVPSLALETLRIATRAGAPAIVASRHGIVGVRLADRFIPTDRRGRAWPWLTPSLEARYISASDVLDGRADPARLAGRVVLFGVAGQGLVDLKQTSLGAMPGIEVQAQIIESMIDGALLVRPRVAVPIALGLVLGMGLIAVFALPYGRPRLAVGLWGGLAALLLGGEFAAFRFTGFLIDATFPVVSAAVLFGTMLTTNLRVAELARRRIAAELQREREIKARIEGELAAARSIQLGLLPHRVPGPPAVPEVDISAWLEPARAVGGDLYDIVMIDERRLFFAIADVSGKGVPAALFMAMSKEVLSAAVSRHQDALDRAIGDANSKICATSDDLARDGGNMMFVTAIACVLDLDSGLVGFVSAGHDAPLHINGMGTSELLDTDGGPPLGTVEDFEFPLGRYQLEPDEMLILYTDGVTEAERADGTFYGAERLSRAASALPPGCSAADAIAQLRDDITGFVAGAEQSDDITVVAVRWRGGAKSRVD